MVVTLTNPNTLYNLLTLIAAAVPTTHGMENCRELALAGDAGNGAGKVWVGDGKMGSSAPPSTFDLLLVAGSSYTTRDTDNSIGLASRFLLTDTGGSKVDVLAVYK